MKFYAEDELLPLSLIQHFFFCERRAALIQIEGLWQENLFTVEGTHLHQKVDDDLPVESRGDVRITRGLLLHSRKLGLSGKADVVEFHRLDVAPDITSGSMGPGIRFENVSGFWLPFPVDYKRGKLRHEESFASQLCAQSICLEEMLGVTIAEGAIYYGKNHRRLKVRFDEKLRQHTKDAALRLHELVRSGITPPAKYEKKCDSCSLINLCMPKVAGAGKSVDRYLKRMLSLQDETT